MATVPIDRMVPHSVEAEEAVLGSLLIDPETIFRVSPFREMGELRGVVKRFGGDSGLLRSTIDEIQQRLYTV